MNLAPILITLGGGLLALVLAIYFWVSASRGGRRTQAVFFTIRAAVLLIVAVGLGWQRLGPNAPQQALVATPRGPVQVRVLAALPIEPWVREAARQNAKGLRQDGQPTTPFAPNSPYAATKAASDHLVRAYHHTYSLPVTITNCSNNYGPYMFPEKLIPLMILNALEGRPLPVFGDGRQIRDWLYVEDHCEAIW